MKFLLSVLQHSITYYKFSNLIINCLIHLQSPFSHTALCKPTSQSSSAHLNASVGLIKRQSLLKYPTSPTRYLQTICEPSGARKSTSLAVSSNPIHHVSELQNFKTLLSFQLFNAVSFDMTRDFEMSHKQVLCTDIFKILTLQLVGMIQVHSKTHQTNDALLVYMRHILCQYTFRYLNL